MSPRRRYSGEKHRESSLLTAENDDEKDLPLVKKIRSLARENKNKTGELFLEAFLESRMLAGCQSSEPISR